MEGEEVDRSPGDVGRDRRSVVRMHEQLSPGPDDLDGEEERGRRVGPGAGAASRLRPRNNDHLLQAPSCSEPLSST